MRRILDLVTPESLVVLNEIFSSTTTRDAIMLCRKIMAKVFELDLLGVWVTFIEELASFSEKTVSMKSSIASDNPLQRTFKITREPAGGPAYALLLARKHRLTLYPDQVSDSRDESLPDAPGKSDFDPKQPLPWNEGDLIQDLGMNPLLDAMGGEDPFLENVSKSALLGSLSNDPETILFRQETLKDCLRNREAVRAMYDLRDDRKREEDRLVGYQQASELGVDE